MEFRIACLSCGKATKYDALEVLTESDTCNHCGKPMK